MAEKYTEDDSFELQSAVRLLTAAMTDAATKTNDATKATEAAIEAERKKRDAAKKSAEEEKKKAEQDKKNKEAKEDLKEATQKLKDSFVKLGKEIISIGDAGIKFGQTIGVTATRGVELEIRNRNAVAAQLGNFNRDLIVTVEQMKMAQAGFSDAFIGAAEGMQVSAEGTRNLLANLKEGFKSEFEPTAETFRVLTEMGISTTEQFDAFRRATGRASLSNNQLTTLYNKNRLSFLLYGNSFAKAAVHAERLGINLASVQAAQESLVTSLDGTIDTVAQMNQLGANIDFGNLVRIAEQEGPDALMAYVRATVPANMMQSASTRALFKQLGISVEDYMKSGDEQISAADKLERKMTEAADTTGTATKSIAAGLTDLTRISNILSSTWGGLIAATVGVIIALGAFMLALYTASLTIGTSGALGVVAKTLLGVGGIMSGLGPILIGVATAAGLLALAFGGIWAMLSGRKMVAEGNVAQGTTRGALGGTLAGAAIGTMIAPGVGTVIGAGIGAVGGGLFAYSAPPTPANDMYSAGYGSRTLVTPKGAFALNNADDIIAGTNLFPKGSLKAGSDNSELVRKVDNLITALSNANTTINVGGTMQTVPRLQLVGVYSRNEVR